MNDRPTERTKEGAAIVWNVGGRRRSVTTAAETFNMPHASGDDFASTDEVKVYKDEGEDEKRSSENLSEDKLGLVTETEEVGRFRRQWQRRFFHLAAAGQLQRRRLNV